MSQPVLSVCKICAHQRIRPKPVLFSNADLHNPEVLKAKLEWEQQDMQRRFIEQQRIEEGKLFDYEPYHYSWCDAFTPLDPGLIPQLEDALVKEGKELARRIASESRLRAQDLIDRAGAGEAEAIWALSERGLATINPVTGEISHYFALCDQMNPKGQCPLFELKRP